MCVCIVCSHIYMKNRFHFWLIIQLFIISPCMGAYIFQREELVINYSPALVETEQVWSVVQCDHILHVLEVRFA